MENNNINPIQGKQDFVIIAQYLKDLSFESPMTPQILFTKIEEVPAI